MTGVGRREGDDRPARSSDAAEKEEKRRKRVSFVLLDDEEDSVKQDPSVPPPIDPAYTSSSTRREQKRKSVDHWLANVADAGEMIHEVQPFPLRDAFTEDGKGSKVARKETYQVPQRRKSANHERRKSAVILGGSMFFNDPPSPGKATSMAQPWRRPSDAQTGDVGEGASTAAVVAAEDEQQQPLARKRSTHENRGVTPEKNRRMSRR